MKEDKEIQFHRDNADDTIDYLPVVKITKYGDYLDVMAIRPDENDDSWKKSKSNSCSFCQKLSKGKYLKLSDNSIIEAKPSENRADNFRMLLRSAKILYKLIHYNFYKNQGIHVTLTYAIPVYDTDEVYHDFKLFWQKLRYKYPNLGYVSVLEPTENGAWHIHVLLKDVTNKNHFVPFVIIKQCWSKGCCYTKSMAKGVDYGMYFLKKINKENELLKLYPPGVNYFRKSRNIKYPKRYEITKEEVDKLIESGHYRLIEKYSLDVNCIEDGQLKTLKTICYKKLKRED